MLVQLQQGSADWLAWREKGLGGSDAGAIMCENKYVSPYALWAQKTGRRPPKKMNKAMQRGTDLEGAGRMAFCQKIGELLPAACMEHDEYKFMRTSLDGLSPDGSIGFELKIPENPHTHLIAREGQVPRLYYAQCQHNLFVSGAKELYFVSWYPKDEQMPLAEVKVLRDDDYLAEMVIAEKEFWKWVTEKTFPFPPPPKSARDGETNLNTDPVWVRLAGQLWQDEALVATAEERRDATKAQLLRRAMRTGTKKVRGAGVVANWIWMHERTQVMPETVYMRIGHSATEGDE